MIRTNLGLTPGERLSATATTLRALVEIGEAIKALPRDVTLRHPDVDWRGFAGPASEGE